MADKKTALVTWWLWYIWSHTCCVLHEMWYRIIILDNLSNSTINVLYQLQKIIGEQPLFIQADLQDKSALDHLFEEHPEIDIVLHFAGKKAVYESCQDPFLYYDNNLIGSLNLLKSMQTYHKTNLIFSSSATVYDATKSQAPFNEDSPTWTTNPYGTTKLMIEYLLKDLATHQWFNIINLRYFNPIGAHPTGFLGEDPQGIPNNLLPYIFRVATGIYPFLNIFGDDYPTQDGTCIRDYIHVMDLADAHGAALNYLKSFEWTSNPQGIFEIFNIGTGKWTSVKEMVSFVEQVLQKKIPVKISPRRSWDIAVSLANVDKAEKVLHRISKRTIPEAISDSWKFIQNQK